MALSELFPNHEFLMILISKLELQNFRLLGIQMSIFISVISYFFVRVLQLADVNSCRPNVLV